MLVVVHAPDLNHPIKIAADRGTGVLIGRRPSREELAGRVVGPLPAMIQEVAIDALQVSRNHLYVRVGDDGRIFVQDLSRRQGSWVRVAPGAPAWVDSAIRLEVDLVGHLGNAALLSAPAGARWSNGESFAASVQGAVQSWLGDSMEVSIGPRPTGGSSHRFSLVDGSVLWVTPDRAGGTQRMSMTQILDLLRRYVTEQNTLYSQELGHGDGFILASPAIRRAHCEVADAAARGLTLVLIGESGTGKEELARCYHIHSSRPAGPFVTIRCQHLRGDYGYIDLFGVVPGGSQGIAPREGAVEQADHGTLFLDEIQDLQAEHQADLLAFTNMVRQSDGSVRRGEFFRMGERDRRSPRYASDVALVCATLHNLDDPEVRSRVGFREDLWFRLAVRVVRVPPLSERVEDVRAFLEGQPPAGRVKVVDALTPDALTLLLGYSWPGNFRELRHFVDRLPADLEPRSVGRAECEAMLQRQSKVRPKLSPPVPPLAGAPLSSSTVVWAAVHEEATRLFEQHHGPIRGVRQIDRFFQDYLKPVMVAHACGLQGIRELPKGLNASEVARTLGFCDGTSVVIHLKRYAEINRR